MISLLLEIHHSIDAADSEIDNYSQIISRNNSYLNEMQKLHEKTFFLESNLSTSDLYTSETSYSNLRKEYLYLWRSFGFDNLSFSIDDYETPPQQQEPSRLDHMLSILNFNLKPLRCRSIKVATKKSKYRITDVFNFNPLAPTLPVLPTPAEPSSSTVLEPGVVRYVLNASSSDVSSLMDEGPNRNSIASVQSYDMDQDGEVVGSSKHRNALENSPLSANSFQPSFIIDSLDMNEMQHLDFDNFHLLFRESRLGLQTMAPSLKKSVSDELIFSGPLPFIVEQPKKFHNPIDIVSFQKREMLMQPTVEAIYSLPFDAQLSFKEHSKKLLTEESNPAAFDIQSSKPMTLTPTRKPGYGLFRIMNSPLGSPRGFSDSPLSQRLFAINKERNGSVDLINKSLATSFMNLVGTSPSPSVYVNHVNASKSPPERIKKMRKDLREPISATNDLVSKRCPPLQRRRNSMYSIAGKADLLKEQEKETPFFTPLSLDLLKETFKESFLF